MEASATISIEQAAQRLGIGRSLAYQLARTGDLPGLICLGEHRKLVSRVQLDNFLEGKTDPAPAAV